MRDTPVWFAMSVCVFVFMLIASYHDFVPDQDVREAGNSNNSNSSNSRACGKPTPPLTSVTSLVGPRPDTSRVGVYPHRP